ncbi:MAG: hypothetical protein JXA82_13735 [Sedimentisphaerales bacterium]|nr:hypothetical protein [Sedimentisphaerales bacterium]
MRKIIYILMALVLTGLLYANKDTSSSSCLSQALTADPNEQNTVRSIPVPDTVEDILNLLRKKNDKIKTYQCKLHYLFIQEPELLDSRTLSKGELFYAKDPNDLKRSKLRINFLTRKQDEEKEKPHIEQFFFDGIWLTRLDYQLKKVDYYQKAQPEKPVDVFELIGHNFPIIGFTRTEELEKQFQITLLDDHKNGPDKPVHLQLKIKEDSRYKEDYKNIDFWIDRSLFLPKRILTTSTEGDIYDISFLEPKLNKKLPNGVFAVEPPNDFSKNKHPLE